MEQQSHITTESKPNNTDTTKQNTLFFSNRDTKVQTRSQTFENSTAKATTNLRRIEP